MGSQTELKGDDAEQCVRCTFDSWEESSANRFGNHLFLAQLRLDQLFGVEAARPMSGIRHN
jgi:hypothetical protein